MHTEFKDHPVYGEYFAVSENGEIYSKRSNKILKVQTSKRGYKVFTTKFGGRNGKSYGFFVHKLVAETYIPNPENKLQVNHIDGDKSNNHIYNLEWTTCAENIQHAYDTGLNAPKKGCNSSNSKFSMEDIKKIRENVNALSVRALARKYMVSRNTITCIIKNTRYIEV